MKSSSGHLVHVIMGCSVAILAFRCSGCLHFAMPIMDAPQDESFLEQEEGDVAEPDGDDIIDGDDSSDGEDTGQDMAPPIRAWSRTYGTSHNYESFHAISPTADGEFIAAGLFDPVWPEHADFLVVKLDRSGDIEWQERMGGTEDDVSNAVLQTTEGGYIVAGETLSFGSNSDASWVVKLDPSGAIEWQKAYIPQVHGMVRLRSLRQTSDGGYVGTGYYAGGDLDFWLMKLDETGGIMWQKQYAASHTDYTVDVNQTQDGGFIMTGWTSSFGMSIPTFLVLKVDGTGEVEWGKVYTSAEAQGEPGAILQTSEGGYIFAGYHSSFSTSPGCFIAVKLDHLGNIVWQQDYDAGVAEHAISESFQTVIQTSDEGYLMTGYSVTPTEKLHVVKIFGEGYDAGLIEWHRTFDGALKDHPRSAAEVPSGGYIIAGDTTSFGTGLQDAWVIKIDEMGRIAQGCPPGLGEDSPIDQDYAYLTAWDAELTASDSSLTAIYTEVAAQEADLVVTTQCVGY